MENEYKKLKEFWNEALKSDEDYKAEDKFLEDDRINKIFKKYINDNSEVLDFGCGSGWAIPEMYFTSKFKNAIGVDQSENAIKCAKRTAEISIPDAGVEYTTSSLKDLNRKFDFIFSCNTLDVVPDEITIEMIENLRDSLKNDGKVLICLNPFFTKEELLEKLKMSKKEDHYYFINDVLRCNYKTVDEWVALFSEYFSVEEYGEFYISIEDKYLRRYYLLGAK